MTDEPEIIAVCQFSVISVQRIAAGDVVALADVALDLDGIEMKLHGLQVVRVPLGLVARMPRYRAPNGRWVPAVELPEELAQAIGAEVLATIADGTLPGTARA